MNDRYAVPLDSAGVSSTYFLIDPATGKLLSVSEDVLATLSAKPSQIQLSQLLRPLQPFAQAELFEALRAGRPFTSRLFQARTPEGDWRASEIRVAYLGGAVPVALIEVQHESNETSDTLPGLNSYEQIILEHLPQCVFLKDANLQFVIANKAFCESVGLSAIDIVGKTDFDLYPAELAEKYRSDDRRVLEEGVTLAAEEVNAPSGANRAAGMNHTVRVVKTPVYGANKTIRGVLGIFWDVTEQRIQDRNLRLSQKMDAVTQLAGGIAHDFNNLLTGIIGNLFLARKELGSDASEGPERVKHVIGEAERASQKAAELTRQLLAFARRSQPHLVPLDLNASVHEVVRVLADTFGPDVSLRLQLAAEVSRVQADPNQIHQVLLSLARNARDAMPEGGVLTFETSQVTFGATPVSHANTPGQTSPAGPRAADGTEATHTGRPDAYASGAYVRVRVRDTGTGITPEVHDRLFEPFFTTKEFGKGTGLSIAMAYGIIKEHHGWIACRSVPDQGTSFDVYLPCREKSY